MIPKIAHFFWAGGPLSYLRHMTLVTFRNHHPDWDMRLWWSDDGGRSHAVGWDVEEQDFQSDAGKDYFIKSVDVADLYEYPHHLDKAPNYRSDFFRWEILHEFGGWYLDLDQIILRPFDELCAHAFVYAEYGGYTPVGVIGSAPGLTFVAEMVEGCARHYDPSDYNSIGPWLMWKTLRDSAFNGIDALNSSTLFYPVPLSSSVDLIYDGSFKNPSGSYALHWFGGHPFSQEFNRTYSPEVAAKGKDFISRYLRSEGLA